MWVNVIECVCFIERVKLAEWARMQGVHPQTAYRWFREDRMPVPARRLDSGTIWVDVAEMSAAGRVVVYARVSSHDQRADLDRQVARLTQWATANGHVVGEVVTEVGSGLNGKRPKIRRVLSDPSASVVVVEAIRQAVALRSRQGHPIVGAIHHSDAGSQYTSVRFGGTLSLSGLRPSVGSVGDAYDNALAETTIGLYKNECVRADSPFRRGPLRVLGDVELITADYLAQTLGVHLIDVLTFGGVAAHIVGDEGVAGELGDPLVGPPKSGVRLFSHFVPSLLGFVGAGG
jgi:hypothetical protein